MGLLQRIVTSLCTRRCAAAMEAESRRWIMRCKRGHETSMWEAGGIRYGARGTRWTLAWCRDCGALRWLRVSKLADTETPLEDIPKVNGPA